MSTSPPPDGGNVEFWRDYLTRGAASERHRLELKGKQELIEVVSLHVGPAQR